MYIKRLTYSEERTLEPLIREWKHGREQQEELAGLATKTLGRPVTKMQLLRLRKELDLPIRPKGLLGREDVIRLSALLQKHDHVVVNRGKKRVYMMPFDLAMKRREQFITMRKTIGDPNGLAGQGSPHRGD